MPKFFRLLREIRENIDSLKYLQSSLSLSTLLNPLYEYIILLIQTPMGSICSILNVLPQFIRL